MADGRTVVLRRINSRKAGRNTDFGMIRLLCDLLSRAPLLLSSFGNDPTIPVVVRDSIANLGGVNWGIPTQGEPRFGKILQCCNEIFIADS